MVVNELLQNPAVGKGFNDFLFHDFLFIVGCPFNSWQYKEVKKSINVINPALFKVFISYKGKHGVNLQW